MSYWHFMDYWSEAEKNLIDIWYVRQNEEVQAAIDVTLRFLAATEDWRHLKQFEVLKRKHEGLCEIRIFTEEDSWPIPVRYRIAGFPRPGKEFVLLIGCKKRLGIYTPFSAFDLALGLKKKFEEGKGRLHEHSL
jgi:hypothetical protein